MCEKSFIVAAGRCLEAYPDYRVETIKGRR
jgi:hypothetical protein